MRKITKVAALAAISTIAVAGPAAALPASTVPGHADAEYGDLISTHVNEMRGDCSLVMNARGEAATWDGMADGHMMNRFRCADGSVVTYHIYHFSHPAYDVDRMETIWNEWGYFETVNKAGR